MVEIEEEEAAVSDTQIHATLHITVSPDRMWEGKENNQKWGEGGMKQVFLLLFIGSKWVVN